MTEIWATLGPACADEAVLRKMFENGMTGIRLNMSHSSLQESAGWIRAYRDAAARAGRKAELLIDLQGPELRLGVLPGPVGIAPGETVRFYADAAPSVPVQVIEAAQEGDEVLIDDGLAAGVVTGISPDSIDIRFTRGETLKSRKSVKITGKDIAGDALTEQDLENLRSAAEYGVTSVMEPFVTSGKQLREVREALKECGCEGVRLFAKIENMQGFRNIRDIIPEADMVVIARGDLGNDMELWDLPAVQKDITDACLRAPKDFLVVTQMLSSMIDSPVPTRAEVNDIFNAVIDGASAVMVTNETAAGQYPAEVIRYLKKTAEAAEKWMDR